MNTAIDRFFNEDVRDFTMQLAEVEDCIDPLELPENDEILADLERIMGQGLDACRRLDSELGGDPDFVKPSQQRFREETSPWCDQSWIIHRARSKPRGFPGDYQMLSAIYDGIPLARGIGGYLDRLCLKMTLGRAVDARMHDAKRFLEAELANREGNVSILNIASGPGREYRGGLGERASRGIQVKCVDSDAGALNYVARHVKKTTPQNLTFECVRYNALRMRTSAAIIEKFGRNDIIYSVGLADYIPDKHLIPMLGAWKDSLNPGGVVYVAFKDARRYDKVEYQWLMDWHFLQRDESDCLELLESAGYDREELEATRDETGVILNYVFRSKVPSRVRVDREHWNSGARSLPPAAHIHPKETARAIG